MADRFSLEIFESIVSHMSEGVIFLDAQDSIRVCNPAAERIRGVRADRILGKPIYNIHPAGMHPRIRSLIDDLKSRRFSVIHRSIQVKNRFFDNSYSAIRDSAGNYLGTLLISRDITEKKLLTEENLQLKHTLTDAGPEGPLMVRSEGMRQVVEMVQSVSSIDSTVLVTGESGTGKERVVEMIHSLSPRRQRPLVRVNCAALPENLVESELFGHQRGAFTGAVEPQRGKFVQADGGILFLDEIGELPLASQAKLLRAIQSRAIQPLGSSKEIMVNVRIVAATNRDLAREVEDGKFREDLYYRLNVITIDVPPLRERPEDILPLAEYFIQHHAQQMNKQVPELSSDLRALLTSHPFPGNVRQLKHALERAVALTRTGILRPEDLPPDMCDKRLGNCPDFFRTDIPLRDAMVHFEREFIMRMLETNEGQKGKTAEAMGISRKSLWEKMQRYGMEAL